MVRNKKIESCSGRYVADLEYTEKGVYRITYTFDNPVPMASAEMMVPVVVGRPKQKAESHKPGVITKV